MSIQNQPERQSAAIPREYPSAITGTWSDLERRAWYVYETADHQTTEWELAEAVLQLHGAWLRQRRKELGYDDA